MKNKRQLRATLESRIEDIVLETAPVVEPAIMTEVPDASVVPDEAIVVIDSSDVELEAVQRAQAETVDTVDAIDQLADAAAKLDNVRSNIAATLPNGGLTQGEAVAYAAATDAIVSDLGVTEVLPALECFGGSMSRLQATQESISSVTAVIKRIFDRAVELLDALLERIGKLAVRIYDYLVGDKAKMAKYEKILGYSDKNKRVEFKVTKDVAVLLGLTSTGQFDSGNISKLTGTLVNTAREAVETTGTTSQELVAGKASDIKSVIVGPTTKSGNTIKSEMINGVQIVETLPSGDSDFDSLSIEVTSPDADGTATVTMSGAALSALLKFVNGMDDKVLKSIEARCKGAKVSANILGWFVNKFGEEEAQERMGNWRHVVLARAGVAPQAMGVYSRIVQGAMSVLSKGTAELTRQPADRKALA